MEIDLSQSGKNLAVPKYQELGVPTDVSAVKKQDQGVKQEKVQDIPATVDKVDNSEKVLSADKIKEAVAGLSDFAKASNRQLNFSVDEGSERPVVKVTDTESGKVIRQIPSEEVLKLSERLRDLQSDLGTTVGILFNKQV